MDRPISPTMHGALDYSTIAATAVAPHLLDFPKEAAWAAYALAGGYLALSAFTDYPPAVKRAVPLKAHGAADVVMGLAVPALPWLLGFGGDRKARNFFLGLTAVTLAVTALTDWSPRRNRFDVFRRSRN
jgi:hypothetical protein